ncbi:MAG: hypothetical protein Q8K18_19575 [Burkholderiales bacterium]|nr:hypothetical protein [Burkholderiales bacterium]
MPKSKHVLSLTENEMFHVIGCLAESLEEAGWHHVENDLKALCSLHCRFSAAVGFKPDYTFKDGRVLAVNGGSLIALAVEEENAGYVGRAVQHD